MLIVSSQYFEQSREFSGTEVLIHIGDFFLQIRLIALRKTAHNEDLVYQSLLFLLDVFQNGVDTFFLGIIDKATGINNDYVSFVLMYYLLATGFELSHKYLTVIHILGAAQGNYIDFILFDGFCPHDVVACLRVQNYVF